MPKIFDENTLRMIWNDIAVRGKKLRDVSRELNTPMANVNQMYQAAYRRFGCNQHSNRMRDVSQKKKIIPTSDRITVPIDRKSFTTYSNPQWHQLETGL